MTTKKPDSTPIALRRKEVDRFKEFAAFLASEKGITPLDFDPISRVISIRGHQVFFDSNWVVTAPVGIKQNIEDWIKAFGVKA